MLRSAVGGGGGGGVSFPEKWVTKMYGSTLLALRGGGVTFPGKKRYLTLEWPLIYTHTTADRDTTVNMKDTTEINEDNERTSNKQLSTDKVLNVKDTTEF